MHSTVMLNDSRVKFTMMIINSNLVDAIHHVSKEIRDYCHSNEHSNMIYSSSLEAVCSLYMSFNGAEKFN